MGNIAIKVKLAGREYPLSIDAAEEAAVRRIVKKLDTIHASYAREYPLRDNQDLLAMAAIHVAGDLAMQQEKGESSDLALLSRLQSLNHLLVSSS